MGDDSGSGDVQWREEVVLLTGATSLIGQHLVAYMNTVLNVAEVRVWDEVYAYKPPQYWSGGADLVSAFNVKFFSGKGSLGQALDGVTTVFNLHEVQDFRLVPDSDQMWDENVVATALLLQQCSESPSVRRFVHLSSIYVQASSWWPNVNGPEETIDLPPLNQSPFPEYTTSKLESERIVRACDKLQTFIVRVGPAYGEGDSQSVVCDALMLGKDQKFGGRGALPVLGDRGSVLQLTYAGNIASGLCAVVRRMIEDPSLTKETLLLSDDTPKNDVYSQVEPILSACGVRPTKYRCPFFLFYVPYLIFSYICAAFVAVVPFARHVIPSLIKDFPSPAFLYMHCYHWTFFSASKQRHLLGYTPLFSYKEAIHRSIGHYKRLDTANMSKFKYSWQPSLD